MSTSKRLSEAVPVAPTGDRLVAVDLQIEKLDFVNWDSSSIRYANFQFNRIEFLNGLSQFKNLVGVDLSNNNVCALSDLRLLSRNQAIEVVDLTNNPITHHEFYREFLMIFVKHLKTLDRVPVNPKWIERAQKDSSHIKDALLKLLLNFLKILSAKSILNRLAINEELRSRFSTTEDRIDMKKSKLFELLQANIIESFDDMILIDFEAHILNDIEELMTHLPANQTFYEVWGQAVADLGSRQLDKLQRYLGLLSLDERSIKRIIVNDDEESEVPVRSAPRPQTVENFQSPSANKYSQASRSRMGDGSGGKYNIELTATFQDRSPHMMNCLGLGLDAHHSHSKSPGPKKIAKVSVLEKNNLAQKRAVELEEILKEKVGHLIVLEKESRELERLLREHEAQIGNLQTVPLDALEEEVLDIKRTIDSNKLHTIGLASLRSKEQALLQEKARLVARIDYLKKRVRELKSRPEVLRDKLAARSPEEPSSPLRHRSHSNSEEESERDLSKLNLFVSIREDRDRTRLFSHWKELRRIVGEDRHEAQLTTKQLKEQRLKEELASAEAAAKAQTELEELKRRLDRPAPPRVIPETKLYRKHLEAVAEQHSREVLDRHLAALFLAWKDSNFEYRREEAKKRGLERMRTLRMVFTGLKETASKLLHAKEQAYQKITFDENILKRKVLHGFRSVTLKSKQSVENFLHKKDQSRVGPVFEAWKIECEESKDQKFLLAVARKRSHKVRLEAAFRIFKEGVSVAQSQRESLQKALDARRTIHLRRKLKQFQRNGIICQRAQKVIDQARRNSLLPLFKVLQNHKQSCQSIANGLHQLAALESSRKSQANYVLLTELKSQFLSQINKEKALLDFGQRRRIRSNRRLFSSLTTNWVTGKRAKLFEENKKRADFESLLGAKRPLRSAQEESNFQLCGERKRLDEALTLAEEAHTSVETETSRLLAEIAEFEDLLLDFDRNEADWQIEAEDAATLLKSQLQIEIETIADLSSNIETSVEDSKMLEICLQGRQKKLFDERERTKQLQRELDCETLLKESSIKDLEKQRRQSSSLAAELKSKNLKLNKVLNDTEVELESLKQSVKTLEGDYQADLMYREELEKKVLLRSARVELGKQIVENEEAKDDNYRLEREYYTKGAGASKTLNGYFQIRKWSESRREDHEEEKESPEKASSAYLRSPKQDSYGEKSTRDLINTSGTAGQPEEREGLETCPSDPILLGLHEDLRVLRRRREGMVCDLKSKIRFLEEEMVAEESASRTKSFKIISRVSG